MTKRPNGTLYIGVTSDFAAASGIVAIRAEADPACVRNRDGANVSYGESQFSSKLRQHRWPSVTRSRDICYCSVVVAAPPASAASISSGAGEGRMGLQFAVFYGSVRETRQGIKYARFLTTQLAARGHAVSLIDPLQYRLPLLDKMFKEYPAGVAPGPLPALADIIKAADGFLIVSGEYNHSIPPALSNLLDHFLEEWFWRPSAIACYSAGAFGGVRAAMQLRATLAELGMPSIPSIQAMPKVQDQFEDDGTARDPAHVRRLGRFFDEFEWYAEALKHARERGVPY